MGDRFAHEQERAFTQQAISPRCRKPPFKREMFSVGSRKYWKWPIRF